MAITFQNAVQAVINTTPSAFDCGTGSNRFLIVGVLKQSSQSTTGVTYNGVSMTKVATVATNSDVSTNEETTLWVLANPASGSNNIALSFSGAGTFGFAAACYNGVDQTTTTRNPNTEHSPTSAAHSVSVATTVGDWVIGFSRTNGASTADGNTTYRGGASTNITIMDSGSAIGSSPYAIGHSDSESDNLLATGVIPFGTTVINNLSLLGVGT